MTMALQQMRGAIFALLAVTGTPAPASTGRGTPPPMVWVTLGTAGGPPVQPDRSQPANLLVIGKTAWLIDCGDGASERLAAANLSPGQIDTVFLSHLHVDHTAGLLGLIALRWFTRAPQPLTIYGPPGTDLMVKSLVASLAPAERIGIGIAGPGWGASVADTVRVVILSSGADLSLNGVRVRAVENSHFADADGHDAENGSESLAYRFETAGYAVGYTGDTGPSKAVERLVAAADLLISEVIDLKPMAAEIYRRYPELPLPAKQGLIRHFELHHLTPAQAGTLAAHAGVRRLVLTHITAIGRTAALAERLTAEARASYPGEVVVAHDLDRF